MIHDYGTGIMQNLYYFIIFWGKFYFVRNIVHYHQKDDKQQVNRLLLTVKIHFHAC